MAALFTLDTLTGDETVFVPGYVLGPLIVALAAGPRPTAAVGIVAVSSGKGPTASHPLQSVGLAGPARDGDPPRPREAGTADPRTT